MNNVHRIRMNGFWKRIGSRTTRNFGKPREAEPNERYYIRGVCSDICEVFVNDVSLGQVPAGSFRCLISQPLSPRNKLAFVTEGDLSEIALEIESVTDSA